MTSKNEIVVKIIDNDGNEIDKLEVPALKDKNESGFKQMMEMKNKYGFSDNLFTFDSIEDAKNVLVSDKNRSSKLVM